ncbi:MAG: hypothetical protein WBU92_10385, partial [Candidatus Dormiibacterota bacterium]
MYRITQAASGRTAVITWPGSVPAGDLDLWSAVAPYLVGPRVALAGASMSGQSTFTLRTPSSQVE